MASCFIGLVWFASPINAQSTREDSITILLNTKQEKNVQIAKRRLNRIFSGRIRTWSDNQPIQIILLPEGSAEMKWLCSKVLNIPESLLRRFIYQRVYRGTMTAPIEVESSQEALLALQKTPGAIVALSIENSKLQSLKDTQSNLKEVKQ